MASANLFIIISGLFSTLKQKYYAYKHIGNEYDDMYGGKKKVSSNFTFNPFYAILISFAILFALMFWGTGSFERGIIVLLATFTLFPIMGIILLTYLFRRDTSREEDFENDNPLLKTLPSWVAKVTVGVVALIFLFPFLQLIFYSLIY